MTVTDHFFNYLTNFQTVGGVSGTIALVLVFTLCIVYLRRPTDHPDLGKALIYALTTIIGFYFGSQTAQKMPTTATLSPPAVSSAQSK